MNFDFNFDSNTAGAACKQLVVNEPVNSLINLPAQTTTVDLLEQQEADLLELNETVEVEYDQHELTGI